MSLKNNFDSDKIACFTYKHNVEHNKNEIHIIIIIFILKEWN